jgi:hypothetical protein
MKHRIHRRPADDHPAWKQAEAVNFAVMFVGVTETPICVAYERETDELCEIARGR